MNTARRIASLAAAAVLGVTGLVGSALTPVPLLGASITQAEAASLSGFPVLSQGSTGPSVTVLQRLLIANGQSISADGNFGAATHNAVMAVQRANGLGADGVVGPATWGAIVPTLRSGSSGPAVIALQHSLNLRGASVDVDGQFGPATTDAVRAAQSRGGISADGVAGPDTWRVLVNGTGPGGGSTSRARLAQQILDNSQITLFHFCGPAYASPGQNIRDTANGGQASAGGGDVGARRVDLSTSMLTWMRDFGTGNSYRVTAIVGCDHSSNSRHYRGTAVDIDFANGQKVNTTTAGRNMATRIKNSCRAAGATEILGPGDAGHDGHVHCAW